MKTREQASVAGMVRQAAGLHSQGQLGEAKKLYASILEVEPDHFDALHGLGLIEYQGGDFPAALQRIGAALRSNPRSADALTNQGAVFFALRRHEEALMSFDRALAVRPDDAGVHYNRGNALGALGRHEEALASYERALGCKPDHAMALYNRGIALAKLGRHEQALVSYRDTLAVRPGHAEVHNNLGNSLVALVRYEEALASFETAIALDPGLAEAHMNLGNLLHALDRHEESFQHYDRALALRPGNAEASWNKSLLNLALGRFAEGWSGYETRWAAKSEALIVREYSQPRWQGERVRGVLLVWGEQGLGDQILHASMVEELCRRADSVVLEVESRLVPLFARSFPSVRVIALADELYAGKVDAQIALASLGQYLRPDWETFPRREQGFLVADPARTGELHERLTSDVSTIVGLSWRSVNPWSGKSRTAELGDFETLLRSPGCRFVDLQYGDTLAERRQAERETGVRIERLEAVDNTNDLDGLSALVAACDLVVTVSNTTAHLAGALGKPVWMLEPFGHGRTWYWFRNREDSPWYPRLRVRRQKAGQPWSEVIAALAMELLPFIEAHRSSKGSERSAARRREGG